MCRLQEQLLETRARESKLLKEKEGLEAATARQAAQLATLDEDVATMRRMLADAGRCRETRGVAGRRGSDALAQGACLLMQSMPHIFGCLGSPLSCLTESRCQASHKKAMEAANEAKRLAPLEPQAARLQEAVHAAHAELERVQREISTHQTSIRWAGERVVVGRVGAAGCAKLCAPPPFRPAWLRCSIASVLLRC